MGQREPPGVKVVSDADGPEPGPENRAPRHAVVLAAAGRGRGAGAPMANQTTLGWFVGNIRRRICWSPRSAGKGVWCRAGLSPPLLMMVFPP